MYLGARPNDAEEAGTVKIVGCMDRVRIWDVALEEDQIEELYLRKGPNGGTFSVAEKSIVPTSFKLQQNYSNPFKPATTIEYNVAQAGNVKLQVFDALGHEVASLVDEYQNPGAYTLQFDAENLASGIYHYTLTAGQQVESRKMMLIKYHKAFCQIDKRLFWGDRL